MSVAYLDGPLKFLVFLLSHFDLIRHLRQSGEHQIFQIKGVGVRDEESRDVALDDQVPYLVKAFQVSWVIGEEGLNA
jgi:hypothetical protein